MCQLRMIGWLIEAFVPCVFSRCRFGALLEALQVDVGVALMINAAATRRPSWTSTL